LHEKLENRNTEFRAKNWNFPASLSRLKPPVKAGFNRRQSPPFPYA
jgi:hypothetical protein